MDGKESGFKTSRSIMRTTVVDVSAKLAVMNGIVQVNEPGSSARSIHGWLKAHMEEHPADRYELVIGDKVVIELTSGDTSRADLSQSIMHQFDIERVNFGEGLRIRLISVTSSNLGTTVGVGGLRSAQRAPSLQEMLRVTRLSRPELEDVVKFPHVEEPWKVVVAYSELLRRLREIDATTKVSFSELARMKGFEDENLFIAKTLKDLGWNDYIELLNKLNKYEEKDNFERNENNTKSETQNIQNDSTKAKIKNGEDNKGIPYAEIGVALITISWVIIKLHLDSPQARAVAIFIGALGALTCLFGRKWIISSFIIIQLYIVYDISNNMNKAEKAIDYWKQETQRTIDEINRQQEEWNSQPYW